jgi:sugar phosphate isomerase/epimerase
VKKSQLAINTVSMNFEDFPASARAVRAAGFEKIEFTLSHVKDYLKQGHSIAEAKKILDENGLKCIGGFETHLECFSDNASSNHRTQLENAELLAALGATSLVVGTDGPQSHVGVEVLGTIAQTVRSVADKMKPLGVNLLIEFNWSPIVKSMRTAAEIARLSGASNVGVLFDPAHYHCTPTKFDQINAANVALIKHVHVNDMSDKPGELSNCNDDRLLPGEGILDLKALFGQIEKHGYAADFSIEMFDPSLRKLPPLEAATRMYRSLIPLCDS